MIKIAIDEPCKKCGERIQALITLGETVSGQHKVSVIDKPDDAKKNWFMSLQNTIAMSKRSGTIDPNVFDMLRNEGAVFLNESEQELVRIFTDYLRSLMITVAEQGIELDVIQVTCSECGKTLPRGETKHEALYGYNDTDTVSYQYVCLPCSDKLDIEAL